MREGKGESKSQINHWQQAWARIMEAANQLVKPLLLEFVQAVCWNISKRILRNNDQRDVAHISSTIAVALEAVLLCDAAKRYDTSTDLNENKTLILKHQFNKQAETTVPRSTTRNFKHGPQEAQKHNIPPCARVTTPSSTLTSTVIRMSPSNESPSHIDTVEANVDKAI